MIVDLGTRMLRQFIVVAEELNFTRAAARVFVAQQALSQQVRRLEADLGVQLFERNTRQVSLTPAGEVLLADARRLVADADAAVERVRRAAAGKSGLLRLGFAPGGMREATRTVVAAFERAYPEVEVQLVESGWDDPSTGLRSGACDVGVVALPNGLSGLDTVPIDTWPPCLAQSKDHPLTSAAALTAEDLVHLPVVGYEVPADSFYTRWNPGRPVVRARSTPAWLAAVATGRGVGVVSAAIQHLYDFPNLDYRPVTGLPALTLAFAVKAEDPNPLARQLLRVARAQHHRS
ncbi:hydrogen peroxide-inducible genes activator OxyR [Kitasatospora saccharophila]|uniref:Hydrogen peroxide-inducible genes activator OxyR n=1 Tax=Kitasatospora saccharophila TaxID=407973 RepID=A0ABP5K463_9ACTN